MAKITERELIDIVIVWVKQNTPKRGTNGLEINENTDLLGTGVLDSIGLVELILYIESQAGCPFDLTDADPKEFSMVKGLCRIAMAGHP